MEKEMGKEKNIFLIIYGLKENFLMDLNGMENYLIIKIYL